MQRSLHKNNIELIENGQGPMTHKVNFMCYLPNASNKETFFGLVYFKTIKIHFELVLCSSKHTFQLQDKYLLHHVT